MVGLEYGTADDWLSNSRPLSWGRGLAGYCLCYRSGPLVHARFVDLVLGKGSVGYGAAGAGDGGLATSTRIVWCEKFPVGLWPKGFDSSGVALILRVLAFGLIACSPIPSAVTFLRFGFMGFCVVMIVSRPKTEVSDVEARLEVK
ncbi:hypothetical protein L484_025209 [Morus notabilis]|uniref:Uncharacterized protein n=1 Tax=Morus notabilis TaxID=981085 RepID=W9S4S1_9ROSA|nr:hypothetical protein L484_025209 [Morus notabilis]